MFVASGCYVHPMSCVSASSLCQTAYAGGMLVRCVDNSEASRSHLPSKGGHFAEGSVPRDLRGQVPLGEQYSRHSLTSSPSNRLGRFCPSPTRWCVSITVAIRLRIIGHILGRMVRICSIGCQCALVFHQLYRAREPCSGDDVAPLDRCFCSMDILTMRGSLMLTF